MNKIEQALTSIEVAELMGRTHKKVLESIRLYISQMEEIEKKNATGTEKGWLKYFSDSTYIAGNGQEQPCYNVTKIGCEFLAHKLKGIKGTEFTMRYIDRFHDMEEAISEKKQAPPLTLKEQVQTIAASTVELYEKVENVEGRIKYLENTMNLDHGQQRKLEKAVNKTVLDVLGGKESNAYKQIGRKVFAECNGNLKDYFKVNARGDVPRKRYEEALQYAENWKPCTNTMMMIEQYNAQQSFNFKGGAGE